MIKKPNQNQAVYIAAILQSIAVAQFVWLGTPALDNVVVSQKLPTSMYELVVSLIVYVILSVLGYLSLSDSVVRKD